MIRLRAALLAAAAVAAIFAASIAAARAQVPDGEIAEPLRAGVSAYRSGDLLTAETQFRSLTASGNPDAAAWLGAVLIDKGATREGLQWLQRSVDGGSAEGDHRLALAFAQGTGVTRDDQRAAALFAKAAEAGHRRAQLNLGILYFRGQGVARDLIQARAWLEKAASDGNPYALYALARAMSEGEGNASPDPVRAADLYRRAGEKGHPFAMLRYALALYEGNGARRDPATAQKLLIHLANNGYPEAALALGDMSARQPTSRNKADNDLAVHRAVQWYQQAADAGVASAQFKIANAYFSGVGIERDLAKAQFWYNRASQQGLVESQHAFGVFLTGGVAGLQDQVEGLKWLILAERGGHPDAKVIRAKAAETMSEADRRRADALVAGFKPRPERPLEETAPRLIEAPK